MGEQVGNKLVGSVTYEELFKSSLGPDDVIACQIKGAQAVSYVLGQAMIDDPANVGFKKKYTNATAVDDEAVGTGDGSTTGYDLDNDNVILSTLRVFDATGKELSFEFLPGGGAGGVDKIVLEVAPASGAIKADYSHGGSGPISGACVLMSAVTTTSASGNVTADGARDGSVDSTKVVDSAGTVVDAAFKAALPKMMFD